MKAEIISIGTELLLGQIANTNAQYISEQLATLGIPVYFHSVVGDNKDRLLSQLEISTSRSDVLIFTGGLGPTKDDLTKEVIAQFLNKQLVLDQTSMERITRFFRKRNIQMTANNERQAIVMEDSFVFTNHNGLAPGMAVSTEDKHFLLFPGPPKELQPMFVESALPYLQELLPEKRIGFSKVMRFCGIGESTLETQLEDLIDQQTSPTIAPLAKEGEVTLRLTSFSASVDDAEREMEDVVAQITSRVGQYQYGWDEDRLESVVLKLLRKKGLTIATAESCTGGLISHTISTVSGASDVFAGGTICYSKQSKHEHVGVPQEVLNNHGAVSAQTAEYLASGVKKRFHADIGLSITGVAGPDSQEGKTVGLVYIGCSFPTHTWVKEYRLGGNRQTIQLRATKLALFEIIKELKKGE